MKIWQNNFDLNQLFSSQIIYYDDPAWITILDKMSSTKFRGYKFKAIMGSEVSIDWFFEQTQNLSLFSEQIRWNILHAEKIPPSVFNKIAKEVEKLQMTTDTILWFWLPQNSKKKLNLKCLSIDKVPFWELKNCVKWLMKIWSLPPESLENVWPWDQELTLSQHLQLIEMVSSNLIEQDQVAEYFQQIYFDQEKFELISLLDQKQFKNFWTKLKSQLDRADQIEGLRLIQLLRSHTFKLAKYKENPNHFTATANDKKIMSTSKHWQNKDILKLLRFFSDCEIAAKAGENLLYKVSEHLNSSYS